MSIATMKCNGIKGIVRKGGEWSRSVKSHKEIVDVCFSKHTDIRGSQNKRSFSWTEVTNLVRACEMDLTKLEGEIVQMQSNDETLLLFGKVFRDPNYDRTHYNEWGYYLISVVKVEVDKGIYRAVRVDTSKDSVIVKAGPKK